MISRRVLRRTSRFILRSYTSDALRSDPHDSGMAPSAANHDHPDTMKEPTTTQSPPSPEPIMRIASGFMAAKHLFAASQLGLFEALAESPATLEALAARTGLTRRAARISADAMVALGLLERRGDQYRNGDV